jgi:hypothetical protein
LIYLILTKLLGLLYWSFYFFRLGGPCSVVVSDRGDAGKGDSFYNPPKNYCNLIDPKANDGEVEEVVEGCFPTRTCYKLVGDNSYRGERGVSGVVMTLIIGVGFVDKEPIPYSGIGWKRVGEQESCLAGVFCLQDRRDKKETVFLRGGVGGMFPEGRMQRVGGDWGMVPCPLWEPTRFRKLLINESEISRLTRLEELAWKVAVVLSALAVESSQL